MSSVAYAELLLISLGPIQDFIASARRCQDLWFGSWLLSDLSRTVAQAVHRSVQPSGVVVFPAGLDDLNGQAPGVANLILATLPPGQAGADVARSAHQAQVDRLREVARQVWQGLPTDGTFLRDVAEQQVDELMEFLWVVVPSSGSYDQDRGEAIRRLAAIKNTRLWRQPAWHSQAARIPKSSLDGERESVVHERIFGKGGWSAYARRQRFGIKGEERLCGVGLLKRLGHDVDLDQLSSGNPAFHSTPHLAAGPVLQRIRNGGESATVAVRSYLRTLTDEGIETRRFRVSCQPELGPPTLDGHDGALLFPSRLPDHLQSESEGYQRLPAEEQVQAQRRVTQALQALLHAVGGPQDPCPYYAFLLADGDNMGAAIDEIGSIDGHKALGGALNQFAQGCRSLIGRHQGSLIFAGGDDVLALLPLHTALSAARELAEAFADRVQPVVNKVARRATPPTLSVGLAIAHCREPMSEARRLAKRAEALAKAVPGKNAFAVLMAKRSGGDLAVVDSWDQRPDQRLLDWVRVLADHDLSAKTAHDLEQVADHFAPLSPSAQTARQDEVLALVEEVLARKRRQGGAARLSSDMKSRLLAPIVAECPTPLADRVRALSEELQMARLFLRAMTEAGTIAPLEEVG